MIDSRVTAQTERLLSYVEQDSDNIRLLIDALDAALQCHHPKTQTLVEKLCQRQDIPVRGQFLLALWHMQKQQWGKAVQTLQNLVDNSYHDQGVRYNLGLAHAYNGDLHRTYEALKPLFGAASPPEVEVILLFSTACHHEGELNVAIPWLEELLNSNPLNGQAHGQLALLYLDVDRIEEALATATRALELDPQDHNAQLTLAELSLRAQSFVKAQSEFHIIVEQRPQSARAWRGIGLAAIAQRNSNAASEAFTRALELSPNDITAMQYLAWTKVTLKDHEGAQATINLAVQVAPENVDCQAMKACILILNNRLDEANRIIDSLAEQEKNSVALLCARSLRQASRREACDVHALIENVLNADPLLAETYAELFQDIIALSSKK